MPKNFKLILEYDGSEYHGWQRQKVDRSVQGEIEKALMTLTGEKVVLTGSGRTDAGVHALGQVANFYCDTRLDAATLQRALNSLTARDIVIKRCTPVEETFHARYDSKSKIYHYRILNRTLPATIGRQYAWFINKRLDLDAMHRALPHIIGSHDFKAFEGTGSPRSHTTRCVLKANLTKKDGGYIFFEIEADGFLRYMVRNITGTLVNVGLGKTTSDEFKRILVSRDRGRAGATAPAHGLFLMEVKY